MKKMICISLLLAIMAACSGGQSYEPVDINPDVDICEVCNMSIVSEVHATELISTEGEVCKFDDLGCMIQYTEKDGRISPEEIGKQYVRDLDSGDWTEIETAHFAYDQSFWTPMSYGVVSFATEEQAEQYIEKEGRGRLLAYPELSEIDWGWDR